MNGSASSRRRLWKYPLPYLVRVILRGSTHQFSKLGILLHERRHEPVKETENIVTDQHLAVAVRSSPDADRGNLQPASHGFGNGIRNRFKNQRKSSGLLKRKRIENQFLRCLVSARLLAHSSKLMHMLRCQTNVSHNRQTSRRELSNRFRDGASTFKLHSGSAAF